MRPLKVLLFLALTSLACTLPAVGRPVIVVTATPSPPPSPTRIPMTATPVPSATPQPSPTAAPSQAIYDADKALHNGDYDTAVKIYESIIKQPILSVDPKLRSDAIYGYGVAALREGLFNVAAQAMSEFIANYASDPRAAQALFLRGDAYLGLSTWDNAIADFTDYIKYRPGLIDSYAYERMGDAYLALGQAVAAQENYIKAVNNSTRAVAPLAALRERVAASYLNAGNAEAALDQYEKILADAKLPDYRASIGLQAANVLADMGRTIEANKRYQQILDNYPQTLAGYRAMQALLKAGIKVDSLVRGQVSYAAEDYNDAIIALNDYTTNTPLAQINPLAFLLLGRAYRDAGNSAAALTTFQTIIDQYPTSSLYGQAWLEQGRTKFLAGDTQAAIAKYKELAEKHDTVPEAAEALWRVGYLYSTLGDNESSLATFEILGSKYKGSEWATDGLFRGGMAAFNQNANARAQRFFSLLATNGTGELQAAGYLWLGRLYQLNNETDLARAAYTEASKIDPGGYYSIRANDLLNGQGPFVPPTKIDWSFDTPERIGEAETWMRKTFNIDQTGELWKLSPDLANDPRMVRGNELFAVAAYDDAIQEYTALIDANELNPLALYQLGSYFYRIGLYREAINAAAKLLDGAKIPTEQAPRYIASLRFPIAYYDLVLPETQKYNIDPLLVFSLIRQESLFEGLATSYAQAQGLMQIIPDTGEYIAIKLQWKDYQNSDLYRPHVNVTFGIYYLYEQLQGFEGNVYAALAAYNGGPGNSAQWLRMSNGDPDLFLNAISFDETRLYVRRIYEQYATYRAIYGVK
ncbi:MAG: tetratricopeptide repeat protein [Anaerolineae bacterium]|nr:tetratricopeptide repeat protein [Anaerolineae bacterium]